MVYIFRKTFNLKKKSKSPITNDNILLRGACLRISPLVYGCAIYTGHHTKVMLNSKFKANKLSVIERYTAFGLSQK